jgi:hypothetical protein
MSQQPPATEEEWRTHVLNIHGPPFEHLCQYHLRQSPDWIFKSSRYPVEFPPSYTPQVSQTKNSELDLWGTCSSPGLKIELLVECKKNNREYTDWIFFPAWYPTPPSLRTLEYNNIPQNRISPRTGDSYWESNPKTLYLATPPNIAITDDGRETKGNYQTSSQQRQNGRQLPRDFTKTSNAAITDAAYQIALATQALLHQERRNQEASAAGKVQPIPNWLHVFLPLVVTTANLWTCQFPAEKVDIVTGEIPFSEVQYQQHPYLFFTYALPPILQFHPAENRSEYRTDERWEQLARFSILVVQSAAFPDLLTHLSKMTKTDDGRLELSTL